LCFGEALVADDGWSKAFESVDMFVCAELLGTEERQDRAGTCVLIFVVCVRGRGLFCGCSV
jgi:hypothetical protein